MTFYEIIILDYGPDKQRTMLIESYRLSDALKIYEKYKKRYHNIRLQKVVTTWIK